MFKNQNLSEVLEQIKSPLIFFAFTLVIIQVCIGIVAGVADLESAHRLYMILIMAGLFMMVIIVIAVITIWRPENLYREVAELKEVKEIFTSEALSDKILDIVSKNVRGDCLTDPHLSKED